jgi:hypothetical protein
VHRAPVAPLLLAILALSAPSPAAAADGEARPWFVPDHAKLQLAGSVGFLSPGVGYQVAGRRLHLDVLFGWVPESVGGDDIYAVTGKVTYAPWRFGVGGRWRVEPVRTALQATYTFGSQYFTRSPDRYPSGYYDLPTAWHTGVAFGSALTYRSRSGREVGIYGESVALTMRLRDWWRNRDVIDASDVFSFAIGAMVGF